MPRLDVIEAEKGRVLIRVLLDSIVLSLWYWPFCFSKYLFGSELSLHWDCSVVPGLFELTNGLTDRVSKGLTVSEVSVRRQIWLRKELLRKLRQVLGRWDVLHQVEDEFVVCVDSRRSSAHRGPKVRHITWDWGPLIVVVPEQWFKPGGVVVGTGPLS